MLKHNSDHLVAFLKGTVTQQYLGGNKDIRSSIQKGLDTLAEKGLPHLQGEVAELQRSIDKRSGNSNSHFPFRVELGISTNKGPMWETDAKINGHTWTLWDFGDALPWLPSETILIDDLKGPIIEKNQCLLIHTAAGIICSQGKVDHNTTSDIHKLASSFRTQVYLQGKECFDTIGELPASSPLIHAELRAHAHDVCHKNHDKDNRSLLCFPPIELNNINVGIVAVSPSFRYTTHVYLPNETSQEWVILFSYRNHMRLARPPSDEARSELFLPPTTVSFMLGWATLLAGSRDQVTVETKSLGRCPHCQENCIRLPAGVQGSLVGKACIKESHELRSFEIQDPWTLDEATNFGPDGVLAWHQEEQSPPLDTPPKLNEVQTDLLDKLIASIPLPETPFDQHTWGRISQAGDDLIANTGSLITSAHSFVSAWRKCRKATTLKPEGMNIFRDIVKPDIFAQGMELATFGAKARPHATPIRFRQSPYPSVRDEPIKTIEHLWPELLEGRLFLFSEKVKNTQNILWKRS